MLVLGIAAFAAVVVGTSALAVVNAQDEQEHREEELAEEEAHDGQAEEAAGGDAAPGGQPQQVEQDEPPPPPSSAAALEVTSPEDGGLIFEPDGLEAQAGSVTIAYSNPSPVPHSLAVEDAGRRASSARRDGLLGRRGGGQPSTSWRRASTCSSAPSPATARAGWRAISPSTESLANWRLRFENWRFRSRLTIARAIGSWNYTESSSRSRLAVSGACLPRWLPIRSATFEDAVLVLLPQTHSARRLEPLDVTASSWAASSDRAVADAVAGVRFRSLPAHLSAEMTLSHHRGSLRTSAMNAQTSLTGRAISMLLVILIPLQTLT